MTSPSSWLGTPREWAIDLMVASGIGIFLGVIGPFGSYLGGPVEVRVPYWVGSVCLGFAVLSLFVRVSARLASRHAIPGWIAIVLGVMVGAAPLTLCVGVFTALVFDRSNVASQPLALYGDVLAISLPLAFVLNHLRLDRRSPPTPGGAAPAPARPDPSHHPGAPAESSGRPSPGEGFLDRLPSRLGRELLCLQMEDHYVRAHTVLGSDLVLTPMREAMADLDHEGLEGLQVHRSFWVARRALASSFWRGRNLYLRLLNGLEVPVSRASVAKLKAAGWIAAED